MWISRDILKKVDFQGANRTPIMDYWKLLTNLDTERQKFERTAQNEWTKLHYTNIYIRPLYKAICEPIWQNPLLDILAKAPFAFKIVVTLQSQSRENNLWHSVIVSSILNSTVYIYSRKLFNANSKSIRRKARPVEHFKVGTQEKLFLWKFQMKIESL